MRQYMSLNNGRFMDLASAELRAMLRGRDARISIDADKGIIFVSAEDPSGALPNEIMEKSIFVNNIMEIESKAEALVCEDLAEHIRVLLEKGKSFRIEVKKIKALMQGNAKTIEVCLGSKLEAMGFIADLKSPEVLIGVVIAGSTAYIGKLQAMRIDYFRYCQSKAAINRSEFKLAEAFEFFGINAAAGGGPALDIGAAPGGWTDFMLSKGFRVIAVDAASLIYSKLAERGSMLIISNSEEEQGGCAHYRISMPISGGALAKMGQAAAPYRMVHVKMNLCAESMPLIKELGPFSMLLIDANTPPKESAGFAAELLPFMQRGATLIMTMKLIDYDVQRHINSTIDMLGDSCATIKIKRLPHNRRELTLYAQLKP
ncbi:MAG: SAM-dependent methyltransferase [Candidatus Micrarchaeaceae archaeon]